MTTRRSTSSRSEDAGPSARGCSAAGRRASRATRAPGCGASRPGGWSRARTGGLHGEGSRRARRSSPTYAESPRAHASSKSSRKGANAGFTLASQSCASSSSATARLRLAIRRPCEIVAASISPRWTAAGGKAPRTPGASRPGARRRAGPARPRARRPWPRGSRCSRYIAQTTWRISSMSPIALSSPGCDGDRSGARRVSGGVHRRARRAWPEVGQHHVARDAEQGLVEADSGRGRLRET